MMILSGNVVLDPQRMYIIGTHTWDSHVVSLFDSELVPVTAIVGGVLAQEMIKVLSQKQLPIQNWFYYNGLSGRRNEYIKREFDEDTDRLLLLLFYIIDSGMVHCVRNEEKPAAKEAPQDTIVL